MSNPELSGFAKFDQFARDLQTELRQAESNQERIVTASPRKGAGRYSGRVVEVGSPRMQPASA